MAQAGDGLRAVFAREALLDASVAEFQRLLKSVPAPLQVNGVEASGPNRDGTYTRAWGVNAPGAPSGILLTLITSTDPDMLLEAMASMTRVATTDLIPVAARKKL
ncbi:MAG: NMCC_0638 family (lipo)protein [Stenotrophomonas sepilia]